MLTLALLALTGFAARAADADDSGVEGKTLRVRTDTCILFDLQKTPGGDAANPVFRIVGVAVAPTAESPQAIRVDSVLVGATTTGVKVTRLGWTTRFEITRLSVRTRNTGAMLGAEALATILRGELPLTLKQAAEKGTVPVGTPPPAISAAGLTTGRSWVIDGGPGATPVTAHTQNRVDYLAEEFAAAKATAARGK